MKTPKSRILSVQKPGSNKKEFLACPCLFQAAEACYVCPYHEGLTEILSVAKNIVEQLPDIAAQGCACGSKKLTSCMFRTAGQKLAILLDAAMRLAAETPAPAPPKP